MKYTVVVDNDFKGFILMVNQHIAQGWNCIGGVSVNTDDPWLTYYQAMIKEGN